MPDRSGPDHPTADQHAKNVLAGIRRGTMHDGATRVTAENSLAALLALAQRTEQAEAGAKAAKMERDVDQREIRSLVKEADSYKARAEQAEQSRDRYIAQRDIAEARAEQAEKERDEARQALVRRDDYSRKTGCDCHETVLRDVPCFRCGNVPGVADPHSWACQTCWDALPTDRDFSPAYQDEYQRLWHRDAERAKAAEADRDRLTAALTAIAFNAESWHGDEAAKGRALAVIAKWARDPDSIPPNIGAVAREALNPGGAPTNTAYRADE